MFKIDRNMVEVALGSHVVIRRPEPDETILKKRELEALEAEIEQRRLELAELKAEAETIIKRADDTAKSMIDRTRQEMIEIKEEAYRETTEIKEEAYRETIEIKKEARQEGYHLGREEAQELIEEAQKDRKTQTKRFMDQLEKVRVEALDKMEAAIIDFCMAMAEKIVCAALDRDDAVFRGMIENALQKMRREGQINVRVSQADFEQHFGKEAAVFQVGSETVPAAVTASNLLGPGDCIIETDYERMDIGMRTMVNGVVQAVQDAREAEAC